VGEIRVHEFIALDGVIENPVWTMEFGFDPKMGDALARLTGGCSALLLGRRTFDMFAPAWSTRSADDDPGVPFFNDSPKHVVSSTLSSADAAKAWSHSSVLGPYDAAAIRRLKEETDGALYVSGSATLVRALLADGLVDRLELFLFPTVVGAGLRLFEGDSAALKLRLLESETYENGVLHLVYGPAA
jgi:dihydrofolate reductase